jgi:hypothetical protein
MMANLINLVAQANPSSSHDLHLATIHDVFSAVRTLRALAVDSFAKFVDDCIHYQDLEAMVGKALDVLSMTMEGSAQNGND